MRYYLPAFAYSRSAMNSASACLNASVMSASARMFIADGRSLAFSTVFVLPCLFLKIAWFMPRFLRGVSIFRPELQVETAGHQQQREGIQHIRWLACLVGAGYIFVQV